MRMGAKKLTFFVGGEPRGKERPRFSTQAGRIRTYTPEKTVVYEERIRLAYLAAKCGLRNFGSAGKPIALHITAFYGIPKRATKIQRAEIERGNLRPTKKPDAEKEGVLAEHMAFNGEVHRVNYKAVAKNPNIFPWWMPIPARPEEKE